MLPDEPIPTTARIVSYDNTANESATVPPNDTEVVPVKWAPVMTIVVPGPALVGLKEVMTGGPV